MSGRLVRCWSLGVLCSGLALVFAMVPAAGAAAAPAGGPRGCAAPAVGQVSCAALVAPGTRAATAAAVAASAAAPAGYTPLDLRSAYGLGFTAAAGGVGQTVAVVTAYDDATAETDMGTYRTQFGLPACTTANGCFKKVNATGGTSYPPPGPAGWSLATAESLDMISAVCPNCHILLVEADSTAIPTTADPDSLGQAENEAVALGAKFVTNTFFTPEGTYGSLEPTYDGEFFDHPGVAITAPDGNGAGYGTSYPAASPDVIAVGGTTLTRAPTTARGWTEAAWNGTGSGCSVYEAKPSWQTDTGCTGRMLNDLSAVADNVNSPVAFYDTSSGGWTATGGNGVAGAIIAATYALAGTPAAGGNPASYPYAHTSLINDITTGSSGTCAPAPAYYCTAGPGYDGPTGLGTPASADALGAGAPVPPSNPDPIYDPLSKRLEVYMETGPLFQKSWPSGSGWSNWLDLDGSITGTPSAVYDPGVKHLEVYARGVNGELFQKYWPTTSGGWSDWINLHGSITGSPAAVYDTATGNLEVYATGTDGALSQIAFDPGTGWTGWTNLQGSITGNPSPIYDTVTKHLEVYARGVNGVLFQKYWSGTWSNWINLHGSITGSPAAINDTATGNLEVYATGTDGALSQIAFDPGTGWTGWTNLQGSITGNPSPIYDTVTKHLEVYARGVNGVLFQKYWSGTWSNWINLHGSITGSPAAINDTASGNLEVYATGTDGALSQIAFDPGTGWTGWTNLGYPVAGGTAALDHPGRRGMAAPGGGARLPGRGA